MRHLLRIGHLPMLYLQGFIHFSPSLPHLRHRYLRSRLSRRTIRQLYFKHVPSVFKFLQNLLNKLAKLSYLHCFILWIQPLSLQCEMSHELSERILGKPIDLRVLSLHGGVYCLLRNGTIRLH